jgi:hypothetical protein
VDAPGKVTTDQLTSLMRLREQLFQQAGLPDTPETKPQRTAIWSDILKRRHVTTARDLSTSEAEELIGKLFAKVNKGEPLMRLFRADGTIGDGVAQPEPTTAGSTGT